jgi:transposase-like protein
MKINELATEIHKNAIEHGFFECNICNGKGRIENGPMDDGTYIEYDCPQCNGTGKYRNDSEMLSLIHSELSEALEQLRLNYDVKQIATFTEILPNNAYYLGGEYGNKPEGWAVELADCLIRILDMVKYKGIDDFEKIILDKMEYNSKRPYKHNKKF